MAFFCAQFLLCMAKKVYAAFHCYYLNWCYLIGFVASKQRSRPNVICSLSLSVSSSVSTHSFQHTHIDVRLVEDLRKKIDWNLNVTICKFSAFSLNGGHHHYAETISFCSYYYYFCFVLLLWSLFAFFCVLFFRLLKNFDFWFSGTIFIEKKRLMEWTKESESQRNVPRDLICGRESERETEIF